jgi:hypothetical protein
LLYPIKRQKYRNITCSGNPKLRKTASCSNLFLNLFIIIIPKGQIHKPYTDSEAHVLMFVKATNLNTGDVQNEMKKNNIERI